MNARFALAVSKSFLDAYALCVQGADDVSNGKPAFIPAVVCAAFSSEVGLKAILLGEGKPATGHNLCPLFERLSSESQAAIIRNIGYERERFEADLLAANDAFTKWRYVYEEEGSRRVSGQFLLLLASATHKVAAELESINASAAQT
jgi:hypothetical protein